jgi:hypothetical protein
MDHHPDDSPGSVGVDPATNACGEEEVAAAFRKLEAVQPLTNVYELTIYVSNQWGARQGCTYLNESEATSPTEGKNGAERRMPA